ncbi:hypothetical protein [Shouchella miscanthi]|uniref:hypothetical protein n=1 Tax=Shouchella miscanthi TaxID=2598861 RepID=UPI00119F5C97|nr:hypothetical protein [Shouchella miscanthi]
MEQSEVVQQLIEQKYRFSESACQYIEWNEKKGFRSKAFEWFYGNMMLLSAVNDKAMTSLLEEKLSRVTYLEILTFFKDEDEKANFQTYTKVVPLYRG